MAPRTTVTVSEDRSLCCKCEERVGRFQARSPSSGSQREQDAQRSARQEEPMSEDETRVATQEREGGRGEAQKRLINASDEPVDEHRRESDDDDDFEAHKK